CTDEGDFDERLISLRAPKSHLPPQDRAANFILQLARLAERLKFPEGRVERKTKFAVIIVDHATYLTDARFQALILKLFKLSAAHSTRLLWLGNLDSHQVKETHQFDLHSDSRAHLCIPELGQDDLIRLYRSVSAQRERQWGEAMLHFAFDW